MSFLQKGYRSPALRRSAQVFVGDLFADEILPCALPLSMLIDIFPRLHARLLVA